MTSSESNPLYEEEGLFESFVARYARFLWRISLFLIWANVNRTLILSPMRETQVAA